MTKTSEYTTRNN